MTESLTIQYNQKPSSLYCLWKAFRTRNSRLQPGQQVPEIRVERRNTLIDIQHMKDFYAVCGINSIPKVQILYPFTLVYPYIMRLLCDEAMPFSLFRVLNTRNRIIVYSALNPDEPIDIVCRNTPVRAVTKGIEVDIISEINSSGRLLWENTTTYFCPGHFNITENNHDIPVIKILENAPVIEEWYLPARDRFRFARISGDTNGIHYGAWYARIFGFERDFAQPIRVAARSVHLLQQFNDLDLLFQAGPLKLDFFLKGPVYYERTLSLVSKEIESAYRFDLFCEGNERPCICGLLYQSKGGKDYKQNNRQSASQKISL